MLEPWEIIELPIIIFFILSIYCLTKKDVFTTLMFSGVTLLLFFMFINLVLKMYFTVK